MIATSLDVRFPDSWVVLPCTSGQRDEVLGQLRAGLAELGAEIAETTDTYLRALTDRLAEMGVSGVAAFMLVSKDGAESIRAVCAIGTLDTDDAGQADTGSVLTAVAEAGPHPGLDRQTARVALPIGGGVRSSAVRWAGELADASGVAPFIAEVRYVFTAGEQQLGILHFETDTIVYLDDLVPIFDQIAATAQLS